MAHEPFISVHVQVGDYPSDRDIDVALPIAERLCGEAFSALDFPSITADPFAVHFMCTPQAHLKVVQGYRFEAAEMLSRHIAAAITKAMRSKDTEMGYLKK